jgi:hypothetical protein
VSGNNLTPKQLAQAYCGSCHLYPDPDLLPKSVWNKKLLKDMARRLGYVQDDYDPFKQLSMYDAFVLRHANIYPKDSIIISSSDWQKISNYYLQESPEEAILPKRKPEVTNTLPNFKVKIIDDLPSQPLTTMVHFDTVNNLIYWGSRAGDLMILDNRGNLQKNFSLESPLSHIIQKGGIDYMVTMGIMDPSEESKGKIQMIQGRKVTDLLSELHRPIHLTITDLDQDGIEDYVVSQFGNQTGKLSWFHLGAGQKFQERIIKSVPGAISTEVQDFNKDGRLDIMALFGQGDERISIFYQDKRGEFNEKSVLRFPPVYGSSSFQLIDFNKDGELDILYTNGDNADYSYSLKRYHGTRLFLNQGNYRYEEAYFYPMYGTTKAMAMDFDLDGDLDILAIGFFPDFDADFPEGFVYLENQGNLNFKPYTFPESINGRWLVADAGDVDGDGDYDIVLGSLLFKINAAPQELIERWTRHGYHMVLLENTVVD